jgi:hypothetical protein
MIIIRKEQMKSFGTVAQQRFVEEMVEHLHAFTPDHAKILGAEALKQIIEVGIQRAGKYGFTQQGPVRYYIEVMFLLGSEFDTDPQFPWASTILNRPWNDDYQLRRAGEFFWYTNRYLDAAAGPENRYIIDALRRAMSGELDFAPHSDGNIVEQILQKLWHLAPEKYSFVGQEALRLLIQHGLSAARAHHAQTTADQALIVLLMFGLGHGCLTDPQFPWIRLTLQRGAPPHRDDVFQNLRRKTYLYLQRALDNLSRWRGSSQTVTS